MFTVVQEKRGCFRDWRGWAHRVNASIKTWCATQSREKSMGPGFPASTMKDPKENMKSLTELPSGNKTLKIHPGRPLDVSGPQPRCRENVMYEIRCGFDS